MIVMLMVGQPALSTAYAASPAESDSESESASSSAAPSASSASSEPVVPSALRGKRFTLVTGDVVTVEMSGGKATIDVQPAPGRERVGFLRTTSTTAAEPGTEAGTGTGTGAGEDISVIPTDIAPLLASGRVDKSLFNLGALARFDLADPADGPVNKGENKAKRQDKSTNTNTNNSNKPSRTELPLIIRHSGDRLPATTRAEAVQRATVPLESIDATAVTLPGNDKGELWKSLTTTSAAAENSPGGLRPAIEKVWLDTPVELTGTGSAADDPETTPEGDVTVGDLTGQINADDVKAGGLDGSGVKVAVIDTGVRTTHPDLQNRVSVSENFITWDDETGDIDGHGTHVAGIIGGTGTASDGKYEGVAPGAEILSARVLSGPLGSISHVINGMEWAADQGVDIVNMSLGATAPTDGTDPWSLATDALLERGVLPVVSAGNSGPGSFTVSPPSAAEGALAVGAAGGDDAVASFSSRGPLFGDYGVKPNIKAPGVAVTAARAKGTPIGDADPEGPVGPVDDDYTRLSGTSMAAPAVAGAAALVMQAHPDWTPRQVSAALVSSARPSADESVYDQGAGIIDVRRAVEQPVAATVNTVDFGRLTWPRAEITARKAVFTNSSDAPVTLDLALDVTSTQGGLPTDLLGLSDTRLTVPARGTASTVVEFRETGIRTGGTLSALLTATAGETVVRLPVGLTLEPESYDLTVNLRDQLGDPASEVSLVSAMPLDRALVPFETPIVGTFGSTVKLRLPAGTYGISAIISRRSEPDDYWFASDHVLAGEPFIKVEKAAELTLGGTAARKLGHVVDSPEVERFYQEAGLRQRQTTVPEGQTQPTSTQISVLYNHLPPDYWAVPSTTRTTASTYTAYYREDLAEDYQTGVIPDGAPSDGGYDYPTAKGTVYYLAARRDGGIPADLTGRVRNSQLARIDAHYGASEQTGPSDRPFPLKSKWAAAALKDLQTGGRHVNTVSPGTRTEYYTAAKDVAWTQELRRYWTNADAVNALQHGALFTEPRVYGPGRRVEYWNHPVNTPVLAADGSQFTRSRDTVTVDLPLGGDSDGRHLLRTEDFGASYSYSLSRDGEKIPKSRDGATEFPRNTALAAWQLPADTGTYTLSAHADRLTWDGKPTWGPGTEFDGSWTFRSGPVADGATAALPLTSVRFRPPVDAWSRAADNRTLAVPFEIQRTGDGRGGGLRTLTVEASFDGGTTWHRMPLAHNRVLIHHPDLSTLPTDQLDRNGHGYVSLRAKGSDRTSSFELTTKKAYKLKTS